MNIKNGHRKVTVFLFGSVYSKTLYKKLYNQINQCTQYGTYGNSQNPRRH
jgi:hypothetical protein